MRCSRPWGRRSSALTIDFAPSPDFDIDDALANGDGSNVGRMTMSLVLAKCYVPGVTCSVEGDGSLSIDGWGSRAKIMSADV